MLRELDAYRRLPEPVVAADGVHLVLRGGRRVLDLYGGHCVNTLGAGDPGLARAIRGQWESLSFATNLVEHDARAVFLDAFGANAPGNVPGAPGSGADWRVFLSNSGAEANENALKAAFAARPGRTAVVVLEGGFHGRTAAAAAVSDGAREVFPSAPFEVRRVPVNDVAAAERAIDADVACVLLEPILSMAGVVAVEPEVLCVLRARTRATDTLLVFDEVQTGNGRLGPPWASQALGVLPDLFTTAKGAAGGLPIGITVLAEEVARELPAGLFGSTFGGGPTVLAAATEVARRIAAPGFGEEVAHASLALRGAALGVEAVVAGVRGSGLLLGLELAPGLHAKEVQTALLDAGVLVGTSADPHVLRINPPLTVSAGDALLLRAALEAVATPSTSLVTP